MSHPFVLRPNTIDEHVFQAINNSNEYRLPDSFDPGDVIVDIGAHVGSFCYAALQRGSHQVFGFEADVENYRHAVMNLQPFGGRVRLKHKAVWRSDRTVKKLVFTGCSHNNSGGCVWKPGSGPEVDVAAFDDVIRAVTRKGRKRVRMVKVDCEGAEYPILLTSRTLHLIDEIVGEFHEFGPDDVSHRGAIPAEAAVPGYDRFTMKVLKGALRDAGFSVETEYHPLYPQERLGCWFARRETLPALATGPIQSRWQVMRQKVRSFVH